MATHDKAPDFQVRETRPFNGGPALPRLAERFITPTDHFFVRNHGDVPAVDPAAYRLRITGLVERPLELGLEDLERLPQREVSATLQCAGNRRDELAALQPIPNELPWGSEAIGNATWAGVALAEVLAMAHPGASARHVELLGLDETERLGQPMHFGGSIPLEKARAPEVLLATRMNGAPLPPVHGAPLRVVVPGYYGARSVKWLAEIRVRDSPSQNYFQAHAYRVFPPGVGPSNVVWETGEMLGEMNLVAILGWPLRGARLPAGRVQAEGVALASHGHALESVEISADGGTTWKAARLSPDGGAWTWRQFTAELDLPAGHHELVVRAWDSSGRPQPESIAQVWNFKGYRNDAWQRVSVHCEG